MEIYPLDWPRLSGKLWYGPPFRWEVADAGKSIAIVPARTPFGLMGWFVFLGLIIVVGTL